jgi:hypothetical protein
MFYFLTKIPPVLYLVIVIKSKAEENVRMAAILFYVPLISKAPFVEGKNIH